MFTPHYDWWQVVLELWGEQEWILHFRMSRSVMLEILQKIAENIAMKESMDQGGPSLEKRLALTCFYLANGCPLNVISYLFGVQQSLVAETVARVCMVIASSLLKKAVGQLRSVQAVSCFLTLTLDV